MNLVLISVIDSDITVLPINKILKKNSSFKYRTESGIRRSPTANTGNCVVHWNSRRATAQHSSLSPLAALSLAL